MSQDDTNTKKKKSWASIVKNRVMKKKDPPPSSSLLRSRIPAFKPPQRENTGGKVEAAMHPPTPSTPKRGFWKSFSTREFGGDTADNGMKSVEMDDRNKSKAESPKKKKAGPSIDLPTPKRGFWKTLSGRGFGNETEEKKSLSAAAVALPRTGSAGPIQAKSAKAVGSVPCTADCPEKSSHSTSSDIQSKRHRVGVNKRLGGEELGSSSRRIQRGAHNQARSSDAKMSTLLGDDEKDKDAKAVDVESTMMQAERKSSATHHEMKGLTIAEVSGDDRLVEVDALRQRSLPRELHKSPKSSVTTPDKYSVRKLEEKNGSDSVSSVPRKVDSLIGIVSTAEPPGSEGESGDELPPQASLSLPRYMSSKSGIASGKSLLDSLADPPSSSDEDDGNHDSEGTVLMLSVNTSPAPKHVVKSPLQTKSSPSLSSPASSDPEGDALRRRMEKLMGSISASSANVSPLTTPSMSPVPTSSPASSGMRTPHGRAVSDRPNLPRGGSGNKTGFQSAGVAMSPRSKAASGGALSFLETLQLASADPDQRANRRLYRECDAGGQNVLNQIDEIGVGSNQDETDSRPTGGVALGAQATEESGNDSPSPQSVFRNEEAHGVVFGGNSTQGTAAEGADKMTNVDGGAESIHTLDKPNHSAAANLCIDVSRHGSDGEGFSTMNSSATSSHGWTSTTPSKIPSALSSPAPIELESDPDGDALRLKIERMMGAIKAIQTTSPSHSPSLAAVARKRVVSDSITLEEEEVNDFLPTAPLDPPSVSYPSPDSLHPTPTDEINNDEPELVLSFSLSIDEGEPPVNSAEGPSVQPSVCLSMNVEEIGNDERIPPPIAQGIVAVTPTSIYGSISPTDAPLLDIDISVENSDYESSVRTTAPSQLSTVDDASQPVRTSLRVNIDIKNDDQLDTDSNIDVETYADLAREVVADVAVTNSSCVECPGRSLSPRKVGDSGTPVEHSLSVCIDTDTEYEEVHGDDTRAPGTAPRSSFSVHISPTPPGASSDIEKDGDIVPIRDLTSPGGRKNGERMVRFDNFGANKPPTPKHRRQPTPYQYQQKSSKVEKALPKPTKSSELRAALASARKNTPTPVEEEDAWVFSTLTPPRSVKHPTSPLINTSPGAHQRRFTEVKSLGVVREVATESICTETAGTPGTDRYEDLIRKYNVKENVSESTQTEAEEAQLKEDTMVVLTDKSDIFSSRKNPPIIIYNGGTPLGPPGEAQHFVSDILSSVHMATTALQEREAYAKESLRKELDELRRTREQFQKKKYDPPKRAVSEAVRFVNDLSGAVAKAMVQWDEKTMRHHRKSSDNSYDGVLRLLEVCDDDSSDDEIYKPSAIKVRTIKSSNALTKKACTPSSTQDGDAKCFTSPAQVPSPTHATPAKQPPAGLPTSSETRYSSSSSAEGGRTRHPRRSLIPVAVKKEVQKIPFPWTPSTPASTRTLSMAATSADCAKTKVGRAPSAHTSPARPILMDSTSKNTILVQRRNSPNKATVDVPENAATAVANKTKISGAITSTSKQPAQEEAVSKKPVTATPQKRNGHTTAQATRSDVSKGSFKVFMEKDNEIFQSAAVCLDEEIEKFFTMGNLLANTESVTGSIEKMKLREKESYRPSKYDMDVSAISFGGSFTDYSEANLSVNDASLVAGNQSIIHQQESKQMLSSLEDEVGVNSMSMFYYLGNVYAGVSSKYPTSQHTKSKR